MKIHHDIIIIGGGPGGSTLGALLAKAGVDVAIIEKETFPRFKIGESLLPYSADVLRLSGVFDKIDSGKFMRKYGAQFVDYRDNSEVYFEFENGLDRDHPYSFEVIRANFDKELLEHAQSLGVTVYQPETVKNVIELENEIQLECENRTFTANYVADASGRGALIGKQEGLRQRNTGFNNVAVFSHFSGIERAEGRRKGDIIIGILPNQCWSWMIPFVEPTTSVGVVVDALAYRGQKYDETFLRERLATHPKLHEIMKGATCLQPIQTVSNYSERCAQFVGPRWILVGDAATFLDPVFSTGVHISLKSAEFAHEVLLEARSKKALIPATVSGAGYRDRVALGVTRLRSLLRMFYDTDFIPAMKKAQTRSSVMASFTSVVGGDAWNEENELFKMGILGKPDAEFTF